MFGSNRNSDYVTRTEAQGALTAYVTKEAAEDVVRDVRDLQRRVSELETLATQLRSQRSETALPTRTPGASLGVDYGAIAFGLSEIARKVRDAVGAHALGGSQAMADEYRDTVQYFADVFAKADPSFDEGAFKRQSGV